jgi:hypothetical protein
VSIFERRPTGIGMVALGLFIEKEQANQDGVWKAAVQGDALEEKITATIGQVLLIVVGPAVLEIDRFDREGYEQTRFFR